jgi:4-diphosphocytidyl-2-C-methyl-D-erythritol kinase
MLKKRVVKSSLTLFSPAKINLFFRVIRKRPDGYHEIASRMQALDFGDMLTFVPASADSLTCTDPRVPTGDTNLINRALSLFRKETGKEIYFSTHVEKHVPMEAGLGGGSSNAATALYAANLFSNLHLTDEVLCKMAGKIGADPPFFFSTGTAFCTGFGEIVQNVETETGSVWLVKPEEALSTPAVFARAVPTGGGQELYVNDLEESACSIVPRLRVIKMALISMGFDVVWMTGSGTTFVCIGDVQNPQFPGCTFFRANFLGRKKKKWYDLERNKLENTYAHKNLR